MIDALKPAARFLDETYDAVRISLSQVSDSNLGWSPGGDTMTLAAIVQHIARANVAYSSMIDPKVKRPDWDYQPVPSREWLLAKLDESFDTAMRTIEGITEDDVNVSRCDDWCPNCEEQVIQGPLDALWFAHQMVRHTAYHLGQINLYLRLLPR